MKLVDADKLFHFAEETPEQISNYTQHLTSHCRQLYHFDPREFYRVCRLMQDLHAEYVFAFVTDTVLVGGLIVAGLLGNALSIMVLSLDHSGHCPGSVNSLLKCLCICDSLFLTICWFYMTVRQIYPISGYLVGYYEYFPFLVGVLWPLSMTVQHTINWLIVLICVERYHVVCQPLLTMAVQGQMGPRIRFLLVFTVFFSVFFNLPRFFEWEVVQVKVPCLNYTHWQAVDSPLRRNGIYSIGYRLLLYGGLVAVGPVLLLTYTNYHLVKTLRRGRVIQMGLRMSSRVEQREDPTTLGGEGRRCTTSSGSGGGGGGCRQRNFNASATKVVIVTICVFIVCELPALLHQVIAAAQLGLPSSVEFYSVAISNALMVLKSSSNFIIYCAFGSKFRLLLCTRVLKRKTSHPTIAVTINNVIRRLRDRYYVSEAVIVNRCHGDFYSYQLVKANQNTRRGCIDLGDSRFD